MSEAVQDVTETTASSWDGFLHELKALGEFWIFRGQGHNWPLASRLERACVEASIPRDTIPGIERQMIREFRRQYEGSDRDLVCSDTLYCMALMQHHGAPTRLLDWSYSPFVAAFFALENPSRDPSDTRECVVWCVNARWCAAAADGIAEESSRSIDSHRDDSTFLARYVNGSTLFVYPENPWKLSRRLVLQQGLFLCPGSVASPFVTNLQALPGWHEATAMKKIRLRLSSDDWSAQQLELHRMNLSRATLFPGLDGYSQSLGQRIALYRLLADPRTGESPSLS